MRLTKLTYSIILVIYIKFLGHISLVFKVNGVPGKPKSGSAAGLRTRPGTDGVAVAGSASEFLTKFMT